MTRNYWLARLLSFKRPLLSVGVSVRRQCLCQISRKLSDLGASCPIGGQWESAYGASIGDVLDDVT